MGSGIVYLVGVGPGDPGLITLKAIERISEADTLVYDYLANDKFLTYAKKGAEIIYVGKKGGHHTIPQSDINDLLVKRASEGRIVARIKGGDPFIFGRGGEEAYALAMAGIDFEIVPGITAGVAVPAYAGIPLTHRDITATVTFVTGHEDPAKAESSLYWDRIAAGTGTVVFFMGMINLEKNMTSLIEHGRHPDTPAAIISWGTTPDQRTITGTISTIPELARSEGFRPPAIIVVGGVVSLREKLQWFDNKPLSGKRVLVTRAKGQSSRFAAALERHGAGIVECPTIDIVPPASWDQVDKAIDSLDLYDIAIFTSANGVRYFFERLNAKGKDVRDLKGIKLCAVGPKTAAEIKALHLSIALVPEDYRAEGILDVIGDVRGKRILYPRAEVARELLPTELMRLGAMVDVVVTYRNVRPEGNVDHIRDMFNKGKIDVVAFASSSAVANFLSIFPDEEGSRFLRQTAVACIGPITVDTLHKNGLECQIVPDKSTIPDMADAIVGYFQYGRH